MVDILPDDISTPHTETCPVMRMHGRMCMRIYRQTYMWTEHYTNTVVYNEPKGISLHILSKKRTANLNDAQLCKSKGY